MMIEPITEKKKAIFESTLELVKDHGFHGCPMSLVAKKACVAAGTIYHYFDSKDALLCELFSYVGDKTMQAVQKGDDTQQPFQDRFFNLWMNLYQFYVEHPNILRFFEQFVNSPYNTQGDHRINLHFRQYISAFFEEGMAKGYLRRVNPEILAVIAHGSIITTAKVQQAGKIPLGETELQQIVQIMWDGMANK